MRPLKARLSITLDEDIIEKLRDVSERDGRPLSQYINLVLRRHVTRLLEKEQSEHK